MSVLVDAPVRVSLEVGCCRNVDESLYLQMSGGKYDECAVLKLPAGIEDWRAEHRSARKGAQRSRNLGYTTTDLQGVGGDAWTAINMSAAVRQGRPMSQGYREPQPSSLLPTYPCARHAVRATGAIAPNGTLVAYLVMLRQGDLALVSQILGHADHERNEIMFLLFERALEREIDADPDGFAVYNTWRSGRETLRDKKRRYGFVPAMVEWLP